MEMMTQLPVMKPQAAPSQTKTRQDETEPSEAISFPTLLQDNSKILETGKSKNSTTATPPGESQPSPLLVDAQSGSLTGNILTEGVSPLLSGALVEALEILPSSDSSSAVAVVADSLTTPEMPGAQVEAVIQEAVLQESVIQEALAAVSAKEENNQTQAPAIKTQATATVTVEQATDQATSQTLTTGSMAGAEISENKQNMPKSDLPVISTGEPQVSIDEKAMASSPDLKTALVDDKAVVSKMTVEHKPVVNQETTPVIEKMNFEVVKDAPDTEKAIAPSVENPALARQSSAELDMLSAQANAQKNYQQPVAAADQGTIAKPTLADLDLDSGSSESNTQKDQSISRILSSINSATSSVKRSIQGQVLSKVVDHLQEEIGKEKLTIILNPEKLGQVEILFQADGDKLSITMSSNGKDAEQAIQEGTRELAEKITENSARYNLVDIKVENRGQEHQSKQDPRQEEKREKSGQGQDQQQQEGQRHTADHNQETGIGEWAAFHLGG